MLSASRREDEVEDENEDVSNHDEDRTPQRNQEEEPQPVQSYIKRGRTGKSDEEDEEGHKEA